MYKDPAEPSQSPDSPGEIMRVPINGGTAQEVMAVKKNVSWAGCSSSPSKLCAIAERTEDRKQAIIIAFDRLNGRTAEVARIGFDPNVNDWSLALSPDGRQFVLVRRPNSPIQILSLHGDVIRKIRVGWRNLKGSTWLPDARGLLVTSVTQGGATLLHVNMQGQAHVLTQNRGVDYIFGVPSPDGRHLAIVHDADNKNMRMMENF